MANIEDITPSLPDAGGEGGSTIIAATGTNPSGIYSIKIDSEHMYKIAKTENNTTAYSWLAPVTLQIKPNQTSYYWRPDVVRFFDSEYLLYRDSTKYPDASAGILKVSKTSAENALTCNMYHEDTYYIRDYVSDYKRTGLANPNASKYTVSAHEDNYNVQTASPHYTCELNKSFSASGIQCNSTYFDFIQCILLHSTSGTKHYLSAALVFTTKKAIATDTWKVVIRKKTIGAQTGFSGEQTCARSFSSGINETWAPSVQFNTSQFTTGDTVIIDMYIYSGGKWNLTFTRSAPYNSTDGSKYDCLNYKSV